MNIFLFSLYCLIMTVTPGPTNIMILNTVHNRGVKKALEFSYGAILAFFILLILSLILNSILIDVLPQILEVLQLFGGAYMLYLAYIIFKMNSSSTFNNFASFKTGFFLQFINPKPLLFTMTVFPSFIMPYYKALYEQLLFVFIITFIAFIAFSSWILFGRVLKVFLDKYTKIANLLMSLFLIYCAIMISGILNYLEV